MKKIFILFLLLISVNSVFAAEWLEIFEKQYLHLTTIEPDFRNNTVKFWVKSLRKDQKEKFPNFQGSMVDYWYSMSKWNMDCINKKERIETVTVYGLNGKPIYWDEDVPEWDTIVPDTYADGFYRLFCLVPFTDNPILNGDIK